MKIFIKSLAILIAVLALSPVTHAQVTATIIEESITPEVPDDEEDNRIFASVSFTIQIKGAKGHDIRLEIPWKDAAGKPVYFDDDKEAITMAVYEMENDIDTLKSWNGTYHDSFMLKPGIHKLNGTIRLFDLTEGKYIPLTGAKKHTFSMKSTKKAPGVEIRSADTEHNKYHNNNKCLFVHYALQANWMKGKELKCVVTLYKADGTLMKQKNGKPETTTEYLTPSYTFSVWDNRWASFPNNGMNLPKGKTNCYAIIRIYDAKTGKLLASSKKLEFYVAG